MGVYIGGIKMPKDGNWITVRIYPDGTCGRPSAYGDCTLYKGAKAVPVPPHGDLIDRDALCEGRVSNDNVVICAKCAPTIIPAEEDET